VDEAGFAGAHKVKLEWTDAQPEASVVRMGLDRGMIPALP